jgi:integrating conjugative element protein (TIGR03761 family)
MIFNMGNSVMENWNLQALRTGVGMGAGESAMPGALKMKGEMQLHTRMAINMFRGRRADPDNKVTAIQGLLGFAQKLSVVWQASRDNDPVADMVLLEVEREFDATKAILEEVNAMFENLIGDQFDGMNITMEQSLSPTTVELKFLTPWAWQASRLLLDYDLAIRKALTARHIGLITREDWEININRVGRCIRRLFKVPETFVLTGIRRDRFTGRIRKARSLYARRHLKFPHVPEDILSGERRSRLAPEIRLLPPLNQDTVAEAGKSDAVMAGQTTEKSADRALQDTDNSGTAAASGEASTLEVGQRLAKMGKMGVMGMKVEAAAAAGVSRQSKPVAGNAAKAPQQPVE